MVITLNRFNKFEKLRVKRTDILPPIIDRVVVTLPVNLYGRHHENVVHIYKHFIKERDEEKNDYTTTLHRCKDLPTFSGKRKLKRLQLNLVRINIWVVKGSGSCGLVRVVSVIKLKLN